MSSNPGALETQVTSVYELGMIDDEVYDVNGKYFRPEVYSRFKYGDGEAVNHYASLLAENLLERYGDTIGDSFIAGSASKHVPTAAAAISRALLTKLTLLHRPPAGAFRIDRAVVRAGDYSQLPEQERVRMTAGNGLALPEAALSEIKDSPLLVVDDIRVTGSHETALKQTLGNLGLHGALFAYIATVDPVISKVHPEIEHAINHDYVKNLNQIAALVQEPSFTLNARTCKFILESDAAAIKTFAAAIPADKAHQIISAMVADGYHRIPAYQATFEIFANNVPSSLDKYAIYEEVLWTANGGHALPEPHHHFLRHHDSRVTTTNNGEVLRPFKEEVALALMKRTGGTGTVSPKDIDAAIEQALGEGVITRTRSGYWQLTNKGKEELFVS
ncbi:MAG TPA: phosphoribosyltransferase family protein [Candidatus Saccharimonadales bacterium]|nr:phosphoribosyltransferase family protein [Candidatus Saccharimonadales bacterium]